MPASQAGSSSDATFWNPLFTALILGAILTLMVLGESEGLALAEERNIAALILIRNEDGSVVERRNALFPDAPTIEKQ